jgi:hypothetical protein
MTRAIARLRLVLPGTAGGFGDAVDRLARGLADALAGQGIVTRQQAHDGVPDGAPRADAALWFPTADGSTPAPDPRLAPARVHIAIVVDPASSPRHLARYDAHFILAGGQLAAVRDALHKAPRQPPLQVVRLSCVGAARDAEKAERGVGGRVVALDLRRTSSLAADLERTLLQLQLKGEAGTLVLVTDDDDASTRRVRALAERHGVTAFLAAGPDAMSSAIVAADLVVGALAWDELLLAASCRVAVSAVPSTMPRGQPLLGALRDAHVVEEIPGTLQLAAALDRLLRDDAGLAARGLAVQEALLQSARGLADALAEVAPLSGTQTTVTHWQAIGPATTTTPTTTVPVAAVDVAPTKTTAQRIEDDLAALKARLAAERTS